LGVVMLRGRLHERRWPGRAVGIERVASFHHAPAEVVPLLDEVGLLPEVLAVVADPELIARGVIGDPPGIAQAIGPRFRREALVINERVVLWDGVSLSRR